MKKIFFLLVTAIFLQSCDDGDIIVTTFNFDDAELKTCGVAGNYVFYKLNPAARESLSLKLAVTDSLYKVEGAKEYVLNGTSNFVNYRTYDGDLGTDYFCSSIPPTSPRVTVDYLASSGIAELTTIYSYDDNDGVPADKELNGDSDGDGLPNLFDVDDDGDNVPTALELDIQNTDGDNDPFTNPLDTDLDGIPDYLDPDDDNDGVLTRNEDKDGNLDPRNDVTDSSVGADYLNPNVSVDYNINQYRQHTYKINKSVKIVLKNIVLENGEEEITQETLNMGTLNNVESIPKTTTPEF
ncbi:hypothetical protein QRD02_03375 [Aequorivita sp. SDUM287046]|uniref:Uncharacterized protein n=1 Tax=Aequorivita aurantiaca TaxID=3053356 RepID=A0ABT8DHI0_9FLAO|nr:hypothetical protein [Aequorivita aurantiaca]MDN3723411.1 hypothetical protein [Aequorivita aurantiaca]